MKKQHDNFSSDLALYLLLSELDIDFNKSVNRREIQRKIYLLQAFGVDFGFRYTFGQTGKVKSKNLIYAIYDIQDDLSRFETEDPFINKSLNTRGKAIIKQIKNIIKRAEKVNLFNTGKIQFLESLMLMHFLYTEVYYKDDKEKIIEKFKDFKPEMKEKQQIINELWSIVKNI